MMNHIQELSQEVIETLSAEERLVSVLLYVEKLCVAEVSEVLEIPPERVIAIVAHVQCRVRMAITGGLRDHAVPLWDEAMDSPSSQPASFVIADADFSARSSRLPARAMLRRRTPHAALHRMHVRR